METKHIVEMGKISSRGQIAIPSEVRKELGFGDGQKVLFVVNGDSLVIKKLDVEKTWEEVTRPIKDAVKGIELKESDIPGIVHRARAQKKK